MLTLKKIIKILLKILMKVRKTIMFSYFWYFATLMYLLFKKIYLRKDHNLSKLIIRYFHKDVYLFNPTMIEVNGKINFFIRLIDKKNLKRNFIYLDKINSQNKEIIINDYKENLVTIKNLDWVADPRSFVYRNDTYISLNNGHTEKDNDIFILKFSKPYDQTFETKRIISNFNRRKIEKNWGFFQNKNNLFSVYSYNPFQILEIDEQVKTYSASILYSYPMKNLLWEKKFGEIRGGASPVFHDNYFWCIFQSHTRLPFFGTNYHIGAFLFNAEPPFKPYAISKRPIINLDFEDTFKANRFRLNPRTFTTIYPCGALIKNNQLIISYGIHDSFSCVKRFDLNFLKNEINWVYI